MPEAIRNLNVREKNPLHIALDHILRTHRRALEYMHAAKPSRLHVQMDAITLTTVEYVRFSSQSVEFKHVFDCNDRKASVLTNTLEYFR